MTLTWLPKLRLHTHVFAGILALLVAIMPVMAQAAGECERRLWVKFNEHEEIFTKANGVAITGEFLYPLDMVLRNLGLDPKNLIRKFFGKSGLSLGEGMSG